VTQAAAHVLHMHIKEQSLHPANVQLQDRALMLQALEYQMQQGMAEGRQQAVFLMPRSAVHRYGPPLQSTCCLLRLLSFDP
jgi:hypothetical protein